MMVLRVVILCLGILGASGRNNGKTLLIKLFLSYPPHEYLDEPLSQRLSPCSVEKFTITKNMSAYHCQPTYTGTVKLGVVTPILNEPTWCLNSEHYRAYEDCQQQFHKKSILNGAMFLFRASGRFEDVSLHYSHVSEPKYDHEPRSVKLKLSVLVKIYFFLELKNKNCKATAGKAQVKILHQSKAIFKYREKSTFLYTDYEVIAKHSPHRSIVRQLSTNLVRQLKEQLPIVYSNDDVSKFICDAFYFIS